MNPFYFGSSDRPLYGVYNPPRARGAKPSGIVLCAPFGMEYMRAHRAFRQLTSLLNRDGHAVLRFDYHGTGDSAGEGVDGSLMQWREDIETAIEELKESASLTRVSLVGLRLGGLLAAQVATRRTDLDRVVLWDPIVRGRRYLEELLAGEGLLPAGGIDAVQGTVGITGYPLTPSLRSELAEVDLTRTRNSGAREMILTVSGETAEFTALKEAWQEGRIAGRYRLVPSEGNWAEGDRFGSALIPQAIIQDIVSSLRN